MNKISVNKLIQIIIIILIFILCSLIFYNIYLVYKSNLSKKTQPPSNSINVSQPLEKESLNF